jgi:SAM-dependent MidA family methyltransferase
MSSFFSQNNDMVSFETFMEHALYDPQFGYYAHRISTVGRGGDFTTSAEISPALAKAIAAWLVVAFKKNHCRHIIELGPGSGHLAAAVRKNLPWFQRWKFQFHLVETSPGLREIQQQHAGLHGVHWHATVQEALVACDGSANLYSNEFFDAFPVRVFRRKESEWKEVFVCMNDEGQITESMQPLQKPPSSSLWAKTFAEGQRIEVHEKIHHWLDEFGASWMNGSMLTIDYGNEVDSLYDRRLHGSLRAYLMHHRIEGSGIYQNIGRQDLTSDINFTDLMTWSSAFTCHHHLQNQHDFLLPFVQKDHRGDAQAIDLDGAGQAFQVWACERKNHH